MALLKLGHRGRAPQLSDQTIPALNAAILLAQQFGNDWYVNSAAASGGEGASPASAKTTAQAAIDIASAGDRIYVAPGHTETVTATSIALNKAGITIICLGNGRNRPTFTYGAAAATIAVSAANVTWVGGRFVANFLDVAAAFTLAAAKDFTLADAGFEDNSTILNFLSIVVTNTTDNAADGLTVSGCSWWGLAATCNAFISVLGALDRLLAQGNEVNLRATNDAGHFITLAAKAIRAARIRYNTLIILGAAGSAVGIFLTGSSTASDGIVGFNNAASLDTTAELIATAGTKLTCDLGTVRKGRSTTVAFNLALPGVVVVALASMTRSPVFSGNAMLNATDVERPLRIVPRSHVSLVPAAVPEAPSVQRPSNAPRVPIT